MMMSSGTAKKLQLKWRAAMFSIQMEATKDLPSKDQCVSALR